MALEEFRAKRTSDIIQLNRLVQQYKHERECNATIGQTREDKIVCFESLMDGTLSTEEFMEDELLSLTNEDRSFSPSPKFARKRSPLLQLTYSCEPSVAPPLCTNLELTEESAEQKLEQERISWTGAESKWISLAKELRIEFEDGRSFVDKRKYEQDMEKYCSEELKEAMQMVMEGLARVLEQCAGLEETYSIACKA